MFRQWLVKSAWGLVELVYMMPFPLPEALSFSCSEGMLMYRSLISLLMVRTAAVDMSFASCNTTWPLASGYTQHGRQRQGTRNMAALCLRAPSIKHTVRTDLCLGAPSIKHTTALTLSFLSLPSVNFYLPNSNTNIERQNTILIFGE